MTIKEMALKLFSEKTKEVKLAEVAEAPVAEAPKEVKLAEEVPAEAAVVAEDVVTLEQRVADLEDAVKMILEKMTPADAAPVEDQAMKAIKELTSQVAKLAATPNTDVVKNKTIKQKTTCHLTLVH